MAGPEGRLWLERVQSLGRSWGYTGALGLTGRFSRNGTWNVLCRTSKTTEGRGLLLPWPLSVLCPLFCWGGPALKAGVGVGDGEGREGKGTGWEGSWMRGGGGKEEDSQQLSTEPSTSLP